MAGSELVLPGEQPKTSAPWPWWIALVAALLGGGGGGLALFARPDDAAQARLDKLEAEVEAARESRLKTIESTLGSVVKEQGKQGRLLDRIADKLRVERKDDDR